MAEPEASGTRRSQSSLGDRLPGTWGKRVPDEQFSCFDQNAEVALLEGCNQSERALIRIEFFKLRGESLLESCR